MKLLSTLLLILTLFPLSAQKYAPILNQSLSEADLAYMPNTELKLLKNELILVKGADLTAIASKDPAPFAATTSQFLDKVSEANLTLIRQLEETQVETMCSKNDLFHAFLEAVEGQQTIPLHLQWLFLQQFPDKEANIYLVPIAETFKTIVISYYDDKKQAQHQFYVFDKKGQKIDTAKLSGSLQLKGIEVMETEQEKTVLRFKEDGTLGH